MMKRYVRSPVKDGDRRAIYTTEILLIGALDELTQSWRYLS